MDFSFSDLNFNSVEHLSDLRHEPPLPSTSPQCSAKTWISIEGDSFSYVPWGPKRDVITAVESLAEHRSTSRLYNPPSGSAIAVVEFIFDGEKFL